MQPLYFTSRITKKIERLIGGFTQYQSSTCELKELVKQFLKSKEINKATK